ncbi:MAG: YciI family protein [Gammaproteobacteria bacterium]|nr:MAG: YciI family protein [Gammaproteobacteria bacterium]
MLYALIARDAPDSLQRRRAVRELHLARVQQLVDQARLIVAGPHPAIDAEDPGEAGFTGSLIIAEFESGEAARDWIEADPYVTEGVFESIEIKPFRQVMP